MQNNLSKPGLTKHLAQYGKVSPSDIKSLYRNASIIANNRVVFKIKGNDYRLIVHVRYDLTLPQKKATLRWGILDSTQDR